MIDLPILSGVTAAVATPLTADRDIDVPRWAHHCRWLLANGCDGLAVFGTTGEANSFTASERMAALENLIAAGVPAERLVPGTGVCALPEAVALSRQAVDLGCAGCLVLPPFYYKGVPDDGLFAAFAGIVESIADPRLRMYLYHFPQMSGVPVPVPVAARLAEAFPGIVVGIKDSSGDLHNMKELVREIPGFAVLAGSDELLLPVLDAGGAGCITAVANIAAHMAREVHDLWRGGDRAGARTRQESLSHVRRVVTRFPALPAVKACIARQLDDPRWRAVRPPLMALDDARRDDLFRQLDDLGFRPPEGS